MDKRRHWPTLVGLPSRSVRVMVRVPGLVSKTAIAFTDPSDVAPPDGVTYVIVAPEGIPEIISAATNGRIVKVLQLLLTPTTNPPPSHLIIGAGAYTNANASIAGNGPHNPFLDRSATFTISDSTITSATVASDLVFGFGTGFGSDVTGGPTAGASAVPETNTMVLIGSGLVLLGSLKRLKKGKV